MLGCGDGIRKSNVSVIDNTPWDWYKINGTVIHVKREDLSCPEPGPSFSKIRGVELHLHNLIKGRGKVPIGVLDTYHSKAGWGVAYICRELGLECYNWFPVYRSEMSFDAEQGVMTYSLRENQERASGLGATLMCLPAGRSAILHHTATRELAEKTAGKGYMMPNALKLSESVDATFCELVQYTPKSLIKGTWVISASSGTLAAGVLKGLEYFTNQRLSDVCLIIHMGYSRPKHSVLDYVRKMSKIGNVKADIVVVDEGYEYKDSVDVPCPFPCNEYYDLKAWKWLTEHAGDLEQPVVFWNVGS